mmetsp:Transcript_20547/g.31284  ORF Transcript_20547/g.31284 Transcript_20547/m.31284 type:complete len:195 (-) Transcript_20547:880-1464(-)
MDEPLKLLMKATKDGQKKIQIQPKELQIDDSTTMKYLDMSQHLLKQNVVLKVLGQEIRQKPLLVGSILRHQTGHTFRYIIRNILSLLDLNVKNKDFYIEFEERQEIDPGLVSFLGGMLMWNHTMSKQFLIFKQEARRLFVKEITKNLVDHETFKWDDHTFNIRLLQNYHAILLLSKFILVPEARTLNYDKMQDR